MSASRSCGCDRPIPSRTASRSQRAFLSFLLFPLLPLGPLDVPDDDEGDNGMANDVLTPRVHASTDLRWWRWRARTLKGQS